MTIYTGAPISDYEKAQLSPATRLQRRYARIRRKKGLDGMDQVPEPRRVPQALAIGMAMALAGYGVAAGLNFIFEHLPVQFEFAVFGIAIELDFVYSQILAQHEVAVFGFAMGLVAFTVDWFWGD